jgi:hypothetical protein
VENSSSPQVIEAWSGIGPQFFAPTGSVTIEARWSTESGTGGTRFHVLNASRTVAASVLRDHWKKFFAPHGYTLVSLS